MKGGKVDEPKRKWKVEIEKQVLDSIKGYREKYEKFLKIHNNTCNKEVWTIYDHLTDDLYHEVF